jgi:hypothetical protein
LYNISSFQILCETELSDNLDVENAATLLLIAEMHGCSLLAEKSKQFIRKNLIQVSKTEDFKQLSAALKNEIKKSS